MTSQPAQHPQPAPTPQHPQPTPAAQPAQPAPPKLRLEQAHEKHRRAALEMKREFLDAGETVINGGRLLEEKTYLDGKLMHVYGIDL